MCVGTRIKNRRKQLNISADELGQYVGVSRATIFRYENGEIEKMPAKTLELIAEKLRTSPSTLMGWDNEEDEIEPEYRALQRFNKNLSEKDREKALKILKATFEIEDDEEDDI